MRVRSWIPNFLTLLRIAFGPVFVFSLAMNRSKTTFVALLLLALTDYLDGYLARRWRVTSSLGAILDPIADKLLLFCCFLFFIFKEDCPHWFLGLWCTCQLIQGFGWVLLKKMENPPELAPLVLSKWNTALQFSWLGLLFLTELHVLPPAESPLLKSLAETAGYLGLSALQLKVLFDYFMRYRDQLFYDTPNRKSLSKPSIPY